MITFLSGGSSCLALIEGSRQILHDRDITVIANTAADSWISGGYSAPDIDATIFLFAGILDTKRWWGIKGDTYATHNYLPKAAGAEPIPIGDRARAVQLARAGLLQDGASLTEAVQRQCRAQSIGATILPMTDEDARILVDTGTECIPLFEYWTVSPADTEVRELVQSSRVPDITDEVRAAIEASDAVVIGPDSPARGILPILNCSGMRDLLEDPFVVAVSPFSGDVSPDKKSEALAYATGESPTSPGVYRLYEDVVDLFVQDIHDPDVIEGSLRLETRLLHKRQVRSLAWDIMTVIRHAVS